MIRLPVADPGIPDTRSPTRLLLWVARFQVRTLVVGVLFGKGQPKPLLDEAAAKMDRILKD